MYTESEKEYTLEERAAKLLKQRGYTVTTAESCTGGLLAGRLINAPGISEVYKEGYITYSNEAKEKLLGVSHETLETYGAVSEQTAIEMVQGAAERDGAETGRACLYRLLCRWRYHCRRAQICRRTRAGAQHGCGIGADFVRADAVKHGSRSVKSGKGRSYENYCRNGQEPAAEKHRRQGYTADNGPHKRNTV